MASGWWMAVGVKHDLKGRLCVSSVMKVGPTLPTGKEGNPPNIDGISVSKPLLAKRLFSKLALKIEFKILIKIWNSQRHFIWNFIGFHLLSQKHSLMRVLLTKDLQRLSM